MRKGSRKYQTETSTTHTHPVFGAGQTCARSYRAMEQTKLISCATGVSLGGTFVAERIVYCAAWGAWCWSSTAEDFFFYLLIGNSNKQVLRCSTTCRPGVTCPAFTPACQHDGTGRLYVHAVSACGHSCLRCSPSCGPRHVQTALKWTERSRN